jgi:hypothetical protein
MLHRIPNHNYIVYPSWATPTYRWEDLPAIFADLFGVGRNFLAAGRDEAYYLEFGYSLDPRPYRLFDGAGGGGIILWEGDVLAGRGWSWLPIVVLWREAHIREPLGMPSAFQPPGIVVFVMEPHGGGGLSRARNYTCPTSAENVDAAGDRVYWVVCSAAAADPLKGRETLPDSARGFGLELATASPDEAARREFDQRVLDPELHRTWFEVRGGGADLGFHFAALIYSAYRLKFLARRKLASMHLVGRIEGEPNLMRSWNWEILGLHYK